jgi:hypothetical protein
LLGSTGFYVASDVGVFYGSYESLTNARLVEYRYSTAAVVNTEPQYKILQGEGSACLAVAVDPETGNVLVSTADELRTTSVVTEINPSYHQAFRFFDQVGLARTIIAYRNPLGPPDKEI